VRLVYFFFQFFFLNKKERLFAFVPGSRRSFLVSSTKDRFLEKLLTCLKPTLSAALWLSLIALSTLFQVRKKEGERKV
jgi:hypothetical protein